MLNDDIKDTISGISLPESAHPYFRNATITDRIVTLHIDKQQILILIDATNLPHTLQSEVKVLIENTFTNSPSIKQPVHVSFSVDSKKNDDSKTSPSTRQPMQKKNIPGIKNIIVVASGKGGVGKSTTAFNLAIAFQKRGLRIGVLDADIYGPSLPLMIGCRDKPDVTDAKKLIPLHKHGLSLMSMGFIVDEHMPMIWRGPMVQGALHQLLFDVDWGYHGALDFLIIDTPPGTGDVHLTLAQQVVIDGAIIVSTPQDMALIDAKKAIAMFNKVSIPIIGLIENMSYFCCPNCGTETDIFNRSGAYDAAIAAKISFLGAIPLDLAIRHACDAGQPLGLYSEQNESDYYKYITNKIVEKLTC
jgi:ATP-binding protein involved in chromosome partitioning